MINKWKVNVGTEVFVFYLGEKCKGTVVEILENQVSVQFVYHEQGTNTQVSAIKHFTYNEIYLDL